MIRKYMPLLLVACCCLIWAACTHQRQVCLTPKIAVLNVEFMHQPTDSSTVAVDTAFPAAIFVAFTNKGADSFEYTGQQANFPLSLSPDSTVCQWSFTTDSVKFNYLFDT